MSGVHFHQYKEHIIELLRHETPKDADPKIKAAIEPLVTQIGALTPETNSEDTLKVAIAAAEVLNAKYWTSRDDTKAFAAIIPVQQTLRAVAAAYKSIFNDKYGDNKKLHSLVLQLQFKVSQFFSLASTSNSETGVDNYEACTAWLESACRYMAHNGLGDTFDNAVYHNLMGGHLARRYVMAETAGEKLHYPHIAVRHFEDAVRIFYQVLNFKLHNPEYVELRHNLMCLASVIMMEAMNELLIQHVEDDPLGNFRLRNRLALACVNAQKIVDALSDEVLVLQKKVKVDGKDTTIIVPDLYRRAGREQVRSYINLMRGDLNAACAAIDRAVELMAGYSNLQKTAAYGQLSAILNDQTRMHLALAAKSNRLSLSLSQHGVERMYADEAEGLSFTQTAAQSKFTEVYQRVTEYQIPTAPKISLIYKYLPIEGIMRFLDAEKAAHDLKSSYWEQAKSALPTLSWERTRNLSRSERVAIGTFALMGTALAYKYKMGA